MVVLQPRVPLGPSTCTTSEVGSRRHLLMYLARGGGTWLTCSTLPPLSRSYNLVTLQSHTHLSPFKIELMASVTLSVVFAVGV